MTSLWSMQTIVVRGDSEDEAEPMLPPPNLPPPTRRPPGGQVPSHPPPMGSHGARMQDTKQPLSQAAVKREPVSRGDDGSGFIAPDADTIRCAGSWNVVAADICFGLRMSPFVPNLAMQEPICRTNAVAGKVGVTVPCLAQVAHVPMETLMVRSKQSQDTLKLQLSNSTPLPHIVCPLHISNLCEHTASSTPT